MNHPFSGPSAQNYNVVFSQSANHNQNQNQNQNQRGELYLDQAASVPAIQYNNPSPGIQHGVYGPTMYSGVNQAPVNAPAMSNFGGGNNYGGQHNQHNQYNHEDREDSYQSSLLSAHDNDDFDDGDYKTPASAMQRQYPGTQTQSAGQHVFRASAAVASRPKPPAPYYKGRMKYRKNTKPLEPIDIRTAQTPEDRKRMQNTLAARKTRARREARQIALEAKNTELKHENQFLKTYITSCGLELPMEVVPTE